MTAPQPPESSHEYDEEEAMRAEADPESALPPMVDTWEMAAAQGAKHANGCFSSTCHGFYGLDQANQKNLVGLSSVGW